VSHMHPDTQGSVSPELIFSDQWFGPLAITHAVVDSTPGSVTFPFAVYDNEQALVCLSNRENCRREQRVYISLQNGE